MVRFSVFFFGAVFIQRVQLYENTAMGSRPYFHILLFFFILGVKVCTDMSEQAKFDKDGSARRTVSLDPELNDFAMVRMKIKGFKKFSHYIQDLVRIDTAELRNEAINSEKAPTPFLMAAEDIPEYGKRSGNETAPPAQRSKVSYRPKKTDRQ